MIKRLSWLFVFCVVPGLSSVSGQTGPALTWNTFLGGAIESHGHDIVLDANKNIYVVGISNSTWGTPLRPYSGANFDAFVAKLSPGGTLIWNTFLGGEGDDMSHSIAVDTAGNVYVAGTANLTWGSPVRAYQGGMNDVWAAKLDASGGLQWNTFLGGDQNDTPAAVAVDGSGNIYVCGESVSTWGSPIVPFSSYDGFLARLNGAGGLVWNTFFGSGARRCGLGCRDGRKRRSLRRGLERFRLGNAGSAFYGEYRRLRGQVRRWWRPGFGTPSWARRTTSSLPTASRPTARAISISPA